MKHHIAKLAFVAVFFTVLGYVAKYPLVKPQPSYLLQHVVVSFKAIPENKKDHAILNDKVYQVIEMINKKLIDLGYIHNKDSFSLFYKHRKNEVFLTRFDAHFGYFTLHIPETISYEQFVKIAQSIFDEINFSVHFNKDSKVQLAAPYTGFQGQAFDLHALEKYKIMHDADFQVSGLSAEIRKEYTTVKPMAELFFWHWQHPCVGLYKDSSALATLVPSNAAPLSWNFSLWDLASKKGKGATVTVIDTGVASFSIKGQEQSYKKNINITMPNVFNHYGYNIVALDGLDPILQFVTSFGKLLDPHFCDYKELMYKAPEWIKIYIEKGETSVLKDYLEKHAKETYKDTNGALNAHGQKVFDNFLHHNFKEGKRSSDIFHVVDLDGAYHQSALLESLPTPKISSAESTFIAGHGTFTYGLIGAQQIEGKGLTGIAPEAKVLMIKAFDDEGESNKSTLNAALKRSLLLQSDIVNMSLKISNEMDETSQECRHLKRLVDAHDYVVAASGNDGDTIKTEAYPARLDSVAFDVGSFSYDPQKGFAITDFTQSEPGLGPKFVAPGFNIFGPGLLPKQNKDSVYVFMAGTSISAPIVSGFMALVLAEFKSVFSKEQILKVIYSSTLKLGSSSDWEKALLGVIDMRSSLLILHILKDLKTTLDAQTFEAKFNHLVRAAHMIVFEKVDWYGKQVGITLEKDIIQYAQKVKATTINNLEGFYTGSWNLASVVSYARNIIVQGLQKDSISLVYNFKNIQDVLLQETCDLFDFLTGFAKERIMKAIKAEEKPQNFWDEQAEQLKHGD